MVLSNSVAAKQLESSHLATITTTSHKPCIYVAQIRYWIIKSWQAQLNNYT